MEKRITQTLLEHASTLVGANIDPQSIQLQKTRKEFAGDLTLVAFPFAKLMRLSPDAAAEKIGAFLKDKLSDIAAYNVVKGFLNIEFTDSYWFRVLEGISNDSNYGQLAQKKPQTMMVEYSSPNTNKPLHLGHLRNIFLGDSVAKILKANGHHVVRTQIINDRGIHICKSMLAWQKYAPLNANGELETPQSCGLKGDKFVGKYYVVFDKAWNEEAKSIIEQWEKGDFSVGVESAEEVKKLLHSLNEKTDEKVITGIQSKLKDLAKNATSILKEAKDMLIRWEGRDPQTYLLWATMNGWVYEGFEQTYLKMGVEFDKLYYESDTFLLGKDVVTEGLKKDIFYRKEDGSVWIDLTADGLDEKLVLRSDGTAVYMTQDIGTAIERFQDYPDLAGIVYTVGNEQDYHFNVLFLILKKLGYTWADSCYHLSYGMVDLPSGKMKSREGTVVDADDLMDEVIAEAKTMTQERGHLEGMGDTEREELYATIGLGGLKYYLLKVDPKKRMLFDPAESIELTGNTGPFIQYTYARIQSLLAKTAWKEVAQKHQQLPALEKELIKHISEFPEVIAEAGKQYSPALLANYVYELVKLFNHFYQSVPPIVREENESIKQLRLSIANQTAKVIAFSMNLLGIRVPERM